MKRYILFILAVLLFCFSSAGAQDTELNLLTVGDLFKWSDTKQDVSDILSQFEDYTVDAGTETGSVSAQKQTDEKMSYCYFYFDSETEVLDKIECVDIFFSDEAPLSFAGAIMDAYELDDVPTFENEYTAEYTSELDGSVTVAGDETICILGGNDPTDEYYGFLTLVFLNRAFY